MIMFTIVATRPQGRGCGKACTADPFLPPSPDRPGQFASAQLQDDVLNHAWSHVLAHEGQARELVSCLPHPHFSTKGGLLYRVVEKGGKVTEQLVVPRPNVSKVLFMARSHL
jgi:hypothetical protein